VTGQVIDLASRPAVADHLPVRTDPTVVTGGDYLRLVTALLQRLRLVDPVGGAWEAADPQWWWRQARVTDPEGQLFWLDEHGAPVAAVIRTDFQGVVQCDVLIWPGTEELAESVWRAAFDRAEASALPAEFIMPPDDAAGIAKLTAAGYAAANAPRYVGSWLDAAARPPVPELVTGFRLTSRAEAPEGPHWLMFRNGADAERRLRECSLYRPELDLMVEAPEGQVAGYGLFWADPVTKVGLVEPMRTESAFEGRGIASCILAAGLDRLAACGCDRLKVGNDLGLYLRAGFQPLPQPAAISYVRP
jgi:hypothetical protein